MQIQKMNSFSPGHNKAQNQSFGMIKIASSSKDPDLIVEMFEQQGKYSLGLFENVVCHILKTVSKSADERKWLKILKDKGYEVEPISQEQGEKLIENMEEFDKDFIKAVNSVPESFKNLLQEIIYKNKKRK